MGYNVRKNWVTSFDLLVKKPIILLPFFIIAFLESLALELIYFSSRKPLSFIASPLIKKFFGEGFVHYPGNLLILPKLLYYAQVLIYIFIGVLLASISVAMVKNIRSGLPLKVNALIKNALKRYLSFFIYGLVLVIILFFMKRAETFIFIKGLKFIFKQPAQILVNLAPFILTSMLFLSSIILQVFFILVIPIIVIKKKMILKAFWEGIVLGFRNFFSIFTLIFIPFLIYLPLSFLRTGAGGIIDKTFPEINIYIAIAGIVLSLFVECFVFVCASQFLLDKEGANVKK